MVETTSVEAQNQQNSLTSHVSSQSEKSEQRQLFLLNHTFTVRIWSEARKGGVLVLLRTLNRSVSQRVAWTLAAVLT